MLLHLFIVQCQRRHRRRNQRPPAAKDQALRGARPKALLALDFCLGIRGLSWQSLIRCISAGLLVNFIEVRIFSVTVHAIHLTVNMPLQIRVGELRLSGDAKTRGPARGTMPTSICGRVSAVRFARNGNISFRGHLLITEALWRDSVCNRHRYSALWAYPLITGICLEGKIQKAYRLARSV